MRTKTNLAALLLSIIICHGLQAQNSLIGDGFGGRLWYEAHNYQVGAYSAYTVCDSNNQLYGWGGNYNSELGNGTSTSTTTPVAVQGMNHASFYTTGYVSAAIKDDSTAWTWGTSNIGNTPRQVLTNVKFADGGISHVVFVKYDGTVWGLGNNYRGQLGNGTYQPSYNTPVQMIGVNTAVRAVAGGSGSVILLADSTCMLTGGGMTASYSSAPQPIAGLSRIIDIKAGTEAAYALNTDGEVFSFGYGISFYGNLGTGQTGYQPPTKLTFPAGAAPIVAISANADGYVALALDENGNVYGWGENQYGQLGTGNTTGVQYPQLVFTNAIDIFAGEDFIYLLKADGTLWASGRSNSGSIWMNLTNTQRTAFTEIHPTMSPMNLCAPRVHGCISVPDTPVVSLVQPTCATPTGTINIISPTNAGMRYSIDGINYTTNKVFSGLSAGTYYITARSSGGCRSERRKATLVPNTDAPPPPVLSIVQPNCTRPTGTITIYSPIGSDFRYSVDGTDYTNSSGSFSGLAQGNYNVTVKKVSTGCTSTPVTAVVKSNGGPAKPIVNTTQPTCTNQKGSITITSPVGSGLRYSSDSMHYTNTSGVFAGLAAGTYYITAKDTAGCKSPITTITINTAPSVPDTPTVTIEQPDCSIRRGSLKITAPRGAGLSYSIDGFDYTNTSGKFTQLSAGRYPVTAKNASGCVSHKLIVTINQAPDVVAAPRLFVDQPTCTAATGSIKVVSPKGSGIKYSIDKVNFANTNGIFIGLLPNTYKVWAMSADGCISNPTDFTIDAAPPVPATPTVVVDQPDCIQRKGKLTITSPKGSGLLYSIDGVSFSNSSGLFTALDSGTYTIVVKNASGCISPIITTRIKLAPAIPAAPVFTIKQPTCDIHSGTITISSPQGNNFTYSTNGSTYTNTSGIFTGLQPGSYSMSVKHPDGCISTTVAATILPIPINLNINLTATPNPANPGTTAKLKAEANRSFMVTAWLPVAEFSNQSATTQTVIAKTTTTYKVVGRTADDCIDTAELLLKVNPVTDIFVPNTFTPNGDGVNDVFNAYAFGIETIYFTVWNQWGQKIWETRDKNSTWDGTFNGKLQPTGVYVYALQATMINGVKVSRKGSVNLIR